MSSHNPGHGVHAAHQAHQVVERLEPLAEEKNPFIAFLLGFSWAHSASGSISRAGRTSSSVSSSSSF